MNEIAVSDVPGSSTRAGGVGTRGNGTAIVQAELSRLCIVVKEESKIGESASFAPHKSGSVLYDAMSNINCTNRVGRKSMWVPMLEAKNTRLLEAKMRMPRAPMGFF